MSANVRCVGNEQWHEPAPGRHQLPVTPCGWKGERYNLTEPRFAYRETYFGEEQSPHPAWVRALTAKPCPRCGGRIVLIEADRFGDNQ